MNTTKLWNSTSTASAHTMRFTAQTLSHQTLCEAAICKELEEIRQSAEKDERIRKIYADALWKKMTRRLIDADKLKDWLYNMPYYNDSLNDRTDIRDHIDQMPAVQAIPLKWLKEQIELASSNGEDDYANAIDWTVTKWLTEVEDGQAD